MNTNKGDAMSDLETNLDAAFDTARDLVRDLGKLGASWVRYGLSAGESTIRTTAHSLDEAARALTKLADRLRSQ
jgi:hypothetical protein